MKIPKKILEFIEKEEDKIVFLDNDNRKYLCQKCLEELTKDFKCEKCNKNYQFKTRIEWFNHTAEKKEEGYLNSITYSYFDVVDNKLFLYGIKVNTLFIENTKKRDISFEYIYFIKKDGIYDCVKNEQVYNLSENEEYIYCGKNIFRKHVNLYVDNLDNLKDTIYKDTDIWLEKEYFDISNFKHLTLLNIIYAPIYNKDFKYLKDLGLKNLAYMKEFYEMDYIRLAEKEEIKKHLEFMKKNDIDYAQYKALTDTNKEDIEFLNNYIEKKLH